MISLDNISTLCIPIVAAILGIAFPIIIQTISQTDTKYNSIRLVQRFKNEMFYKHLYPSLIVAVVVLFYNNFLFFPWAYERGFINYLMSNSSNIIVLLSTGYIVFVLFKVVKLIIRYYDYKKLFYRIFKSTTKNNTINETDVRDLAELAKYITLKDDNDTLREFYQFLNDYTRRVQEKESLNPVVYNPWFYDIILSLNDTICRANILPISIVKGNDIVQLLIPESGESVISDKTYSVLWRALQQQLFYNKTEWVFSYWAFAHQFRWLRLKPRVVGFHAVYSEEEVMIRDKQIIRFTEFHSALCGYILYLKEYQLIKQITSYTQSEPYQFPLVPSTLKEIIDEFKKLSNIGSEQSFHFQKHYLFPGVKGVDSGDVSIAWYKRYLTLLLFRLNSFEVHYTASYIEPWQIPAIPDKLNEMSALLSIIEQMMRFVKEWKEKENLSVLKELGWSVENDDDDNNKRNIDPLDKLNGFKCQLEEAITEKERNLDQSTGKRDQFDKRTKEIIEDNAVVYRRVLDKCDCDVADLGKDVLNSSRCEKMKQETFSDQQRYTHGNYDEVMAFAMVDDFINLYSLSFYKHKKRHYTINSEDMFGAFDRLIGENRKEYAVIVFGFNLDFYLKDPDVRKSLNIVDNKSRQYTKYSYDNDLDIHSLPSAGNGIMNQAVVILKKDDLPCYENYKPTTDIIDRLKLDSEPVDEELKIYTSVLFNDFPEKYKELEGSEFCLATIYYCVILYWEKDADVTILKTITRYLDSGKGMNVDDLPQL